MPDPDASPSGDRRFELRAEAQRRVGEAERRARRAAAEAVGVDWKTSAEAEIAYVAEVTRALRAESEALGDEAAEMAERLRAYERSTRPGVDAPAVVDAVEARSGPQAVPGRGHRLDGTPRPRLPLIPAPVRVRGCGLDRFDPCTSVNVSVAGAPLAQDESIGLQSSAEDCDAHFRLILRSRGESFQRGAVGRVESGHRVKGARWRDVAAWCLRPRVTVAGTLEAATGGTAPGSPSSTMWANVRVGLHAWSLPTDPGDWYHQWWDGPLFDLRLGPGENVRHVVVADTGHLPAMTFRPPWVDQDGERSVDVVVECEIAVSIQGFAEVLFALDRFPGVRFAGLEWGVTSDFAALLPPEPFRPWRPGGAPPVE